MLLPRHRVNHVQRIQKQMRVELQPQLGQLRFLMAELFLVKINLECCNSADHLVEVAVDSADFRNGVVFRQTLSDCAAPKLLRENRDILHRLYRKVVKNPQRYQQHGKKCQQQYARNEDVLPVQRRKEQFNRQAQVQCVRNL